MVEYRGTGGQRKTQDLIPGGPEGLESLKHILLECVTSQIQLQSVQMLFHFVNRQVFSYPGPSQRVQDVDRTDPSAVPGDATQPGTLAYPMLPHPIVLMFASDIRANK